MTDFIYSGGVKFNDTAVCDIKMDKDGNPTVCKNPVTGAEISGGGGGDSFELTIHNAETEEQLQLWILNVAGSEYKPVTLVIDVNEDAVISIPAIKNTVVIYDYDSYANIVGFQGLDIESTSGDISVDYDEDDNTVVAKVVLTGDAEITLGYSK